MADKPPYNATVNPLRDPQKLPRGLVASRRERTKAEGAGIPIRKYQRYGYLRRAGIKDYRFGLDPDSLYEEGLVRGNAAAQEYLDWLHNLDLTDPAQRNAWDAFSRVTDETRCQKAAHSVLSREKRMRRAQKNWGERAVLINKMEERPLLWGSLDKGLVDGVWGGLATARLFKKCPQRPTRGRLRELAPVFGPARKETEAEREARLERVRENVAEREAEFDVHTPHLAGFFKKPSIFQKIKNLFRRGSRY